MVTALPRGDLLQTNGRWYIGHLVLGVGFVCLVSLNIGWWMGRGRGACEILSAQVAFVSILLVLVNIGHGAMHPFGYIVKGGGVIGCFVG